MEILKIMDMQLTYQNFREVIYQTRKTVFDHISKHREESWKYDAQRSIFDELRGLEMCSNTVLSVWYVYTIETKTKEKTEK